MFFAIIAAAIAAGMPVKAGQYAESGSPCADAKGSVCGTVAADPITVFCSSHYRNETGVENSQITFFAGIDISKTGYRQDQIRVHFTFESAEGKTVRKRAKHFDGREISAKSKRKT